MFDVDKVIKVDICTNNGNILQSVSKGFSFPRFQDKDNSMVRLLIIKGHHLPVFQRGSPVVSIVYLKKGDRLSFSSVITVSTESQLNIGIYLDKTVVLEERRRYFKIECSLPYRVVGLIRNKEKFLVDPPLEGQIKNINIGGVFLGVDTDPILQVGDVVTTRIPALNKDGDEYLLNVLRAQTAPDGRFMGYGCKFLFLDPKREEYISQFINLMQIEKRRQEKS